MYAIQGSVYISVFKKKKGLPPVFKLGINSSNPHWQSSLTSCLEPFLSFSIVSIRDHELEDAYLFFLDFCADNSLRRATKIHLSANSNTLRNAYAQSCLLPLKEWDISSGILLLLDSFCSSVSDFTISPSSRFMVNTQLRTMIYFVPCVLVCYFTLFCGGFCGRPVYSML